MWRVPGSKQARQTKTILAQAGVLWRARAQNMPRVAKQTDSRVYHTPWPASGRAAMSRRFDFDVCGLAVEGPELKLGPGFKNNNFGIGGLGRESPGFKSDPWQVKRWILKWAGCPGLKIGPWQLKSSILAYASLPWRVPGSKQTSGS